MPALRTDGRICTWDRRSYMRLGQTVVYALGTDGFYMRLGQTVMHALGTSCGPPNNDQHAACNVLPV